MTETADPVSPTAPSGHVPSPGAGWRPFVVAERRDESPQVTSFLLRPVDGAPLPPHRAGQHLTLRLERPGSAPLVRDYTISCAPNGDHWRISVKREPKGAASNWLHDHLPVGQHLEVRAPSGDFVLPDEATRPVVMVSAGVGITPMIAMLEAAVAAGDARPIHFVHGTRDRATHAFADHVAALAGRHAGAIRLDVFYSRPRPEDGAGPDGTHAGRIGLDWLRAETPLREASYLLCGPLDFLRDMANGLASAGVPRSRIRFEFFGAAEDIFDDGAAAAPLSRPATAPLPVATDETMAIEEQVGRALVASPADGVVASDRDGTITVWNAGAERIFGFSPAEALGQSLDIIIPEPFRARHWEGYHQTVATGESRYGAGDLLAVPGLCKDGRRISIEFTIVLMKDGSGRVSGMVSSVRDVSRRFEETKALKKRVAELEKATGAA
ncbi:PAS domain S-box protein [Azorhizobium doebereinerae]|uniref:PAS domain S-box protein n=1 Tax=Azorhizobium doebereinerae TaxID=281091 RepID=UPI0004138CF6